MTSLNGYTHKKINAILLIICKIFMDFSCKKPLRRINIVPVNTPAIRYIPNMSYIVIYSLN